MPTLTALIHKWTDIPYEELVQMREDAEEEVRLEIERIENMSVQEAEWEIAKAEQTEPKFDKDINVRSKTEVLTQIHELYAEMEKLLRKSSAEIVGAIREQMEKEKSDA